MNQAIQNGVGQSRITDVFDPVLNGDGKELVDRLCQQLFTYYLWEVYPLTGNESLHERFYDKTKNDRKRWGQLFDHVGRSLRNSGRVLDKTLTDRIIAFFYWRFEAAEPLELQEFTFFVWKPNA